MDQALHRRIRGLKPADAEALMTSLTRELEEAREAIVKKDPSRPDPRLLLKARGAIANFEWLAIAAYRMRGSWDNAEPALQALESWRQDWNIVASAALVHAREELEGVEKNSPEFDRLYKTLMDIAGIVAMTFRPLVGPKSGWIGVQAKAADKAPH